MDSFANNNSKNHLEDINLLLKEAAVQSGKYSSRDKN